MHKRNAGWLIVLVAVLFSAGMVWYLLPPSRSFGMVLVGTGAPGTSWSREVQFSVDGAGNITFDRTTATIAFSEGKLVVEKARMLLNDQEVAPLAEDVQKVDVDYSAGVLTITADGKKVHASKLRK